MRKDGNQSKAAPVWFTTTPDHVLLINTRPDSWKAKRIKRGSPAMIWIGSEDGPAFIGKAEITSDPALQARIITDYPEKYLTARVGLFKPSQEKYDKGNERGDQNHAGARFAGAFCLAAGDPGPTPANPPPHTELADRQPTRSLIIGMVREYRVN